jgi:hypothetical protein
MSQRVMAQLSWGSIVGGSIAWAIVILGIIPKNIICSYIAAYSTEVNSIIALDHCFESLNQTISWLLILLASMSLFFGIVTLVKGRDKPSAHRFLSLLGIAMGLGVLILLGLAWLIRD